MERLLSKRKLLSLPFWAFVVLLPFGQLVSTSLDYYGFRVHLLGLDIVMAASAAYGLFIYNKSKAEHTYFKATMPFLVYMFFGLALGAFLLDSFSPIPFLYAVRLVIYVVATLYFVHFFQRKKVHTEVKYLLVGIVSAAILGLVQYMYLPDLRALKVYGWDDHLGRLVGGYLDPGFMALMMVVGSLVALYNAYEKNGAEYYLVFGLLTLTLLLTYSRAGYLAFGIGVIYLGYSLKKLVLTSVLLILFLFSVLLLPRNEGIGVKLERTHSIEQRLINYSESIKVIKENPVFGVGYNNLCLVKKGSDPQSHSCFGADNSFLFLISTLGVVGVLVLLKTLTSIYEPVKKDTLLKVVVLSVLVSSMFINALTYPFVLAVLVFMYSQSITQQKKQ